MAPHWLVFVIVVVAANNDTDRDTRLGRGGSPNVVCGPWTNRLVYIGFTQVRITLLQKLAIAILQACFL